DTLLPIMESGQAELVATDYAFDDNVWVEPWPGHTPGHVCVVVRCQRASVILSGDIMHTALQCAEPQLNSCFCVDVEAARATRRRLLETFADTPVMLIPAHFPTPTAGQPIRQVEPRRVLLTEDGLFTLWAARGPYGFASPEQVRTSWDENVGPKVVLA